MTAERDVKQSAAPGLDSQRRRPVGIAPLTLIALYLGLSAARGVGAVPASWALMPVVDTAWLNGLVVAAALAWMLLSGTPFAEIGLRGPRIGIPLGRIVVATIVIDTVLVGAATPFLEGIFGAASPVDRFAAIPGNLQLLIFLIPAMWLLAAFGEEFFFRGLLLTTLARLLGGSRAAVAGAVVLQAVAFGAIHLYQGPAKAAAIGVGGLVYGAAFVLAGWSLWPVILAHGINDTIGLLLVYTGTVQA
ncbi:MAG: CPBP family intramembrane metalloprotease [Acidobacteria bacterium]|nr:CPBP family intramembrane metalloprotease [Acidobacteriota bacterium]